MAQVTEWDLEEVTSDLILPKFKNKNIIDSILKGASTPLQDIIDTGFDISEEFNLETYNSSMLDLIGKLLNVPKMGVDNVEEYRQSVKAKILVNKSTGSAKTLIPLLNEILGEGTFSLKEQFPAEVSIRLYETQTILTEELINEILPIGVNGLFLQNPYEDLVVWEVSEVAGPDLPESVLPDLADLDTTDKVMIDLIFT